MIINKNHNQGEPIRLGRHQNTGSQWPLILAVLFAFVLIAREWSLEGLGFLEIALIIGLAVVCLVPMFRWYSKGMRWLPTGEVYVLMHLVYYVFPCLSGRRDWLIFEESQRVAVLLAVGVFLAVFQITYSLFLRRSRLPFSETSALSRKVGQVTMWVCFTLWLTWSLLLQNNLLPNMGGAFQFFRSIMTAGGSLSIIFLFYRWGQRRFPGLEYFVLTGGFVMGLAVNFASGFLSGTAELLGAALLAFSMGRKQVPVKAVAISVVLVAILHLGKADYRSAYWRKGANYTEQRIDVVSAYETWLTASWQHLLQRNDPGSAKQGMLERTSLVQILAKAMDSTPAKQPFLFGQTYLMLPELMVPRIFWPEKPRGTLPTETIGIYYGIQTARHAEYTSIAVGPLAEAWANFGWLGLVAVGVFLGMLFGLPAMLTRALKPYQVGWLLASIFLVYSIVQENCLAETITSLSIALLMGGIMLISTSRVLPSRQFGKKRDPVESHPFKQIGPGESIST